MAVKSHPASRRRHFCSCFGLAELSSPPGQVGVWGLQAHRLPLALPLASQTVAWLHFLCPSAVVCAFKKAKRQARGPGSYNLWCFLCHVCWREHLQCLHHFFFTEKQCLIVVLVSVPVFAQMRIRCSRWPRMRRCLPGEQWRSPAGWLRTTTLLCSGPTQRSRPCTLEGREVRWQNKHIN